jgi:diguanylate cyclase (GGDEF)-like protein/PAS domain S-box-containing protein
MGSYFRGLRGKAALAAMELGSQPAPRLARRLSAFDTPFASAFDDVVRFAARSVDMPMAAISLFEDDHLWFAASFGLETSSADEGSFCEEVIATGKELVVPDTRADLRFAQAAFVERNNFRFYAGVPVKQLGTNVGTLCVLDRKPRTFTAQQRSTLRFLGRQVEHLLDLHTRRAVELPPSPQTVLQAAKQISDCDISEVAGVLTHLDRPSWIYDPSTLEFLAVNDAAIRQYGWTEAEFLSLSMLEIHSPEDRHVMRAVIADGEFDGYVPSRLWKHQRADREPIDVKIVSAWTNWKGRPARLVTATDVTAQVALSDALDRAAHIDSLTGLANRRQFIRMLTELLDTRSQVFAVFFIDLDRFKMVNDTVGHDAGDSLLGAAAARVRACSPNSEQVARLGGDEFAVVHAVSSVNEARQIAERIRVRLEHPFVLDSIEYYVSASVGIAMSRPDSTSQSLLAEADAAMYAAKDAGRNGCALFDSQLRQQMSDWSSVVRDLHRAIDQNQIELDYQPILHFDSGTVEFEALARWQHPTRGRLSPGSFIEVAEESGLIHRLGAHILELGASHAAVLGTPVSVNVSVRQFNRTLVKQVETLIERHQLTPGQLVIEVTESAVGDTDHARSILNGLRDAGARTWIDDFGTGFSSLGRINSLPFDGLKLAREFVANLDEPQGLGIARAIVSIADALHIPVIAEGIETPQQLEQVRELGCAFGQGYLLGRPAPFAERETWRRSVDQAFTPRSTIG